MCAVGSRKAALAIVAMLSLILALAAAGDAQAERLPIKSYTTADGLAREQVNRINQDSRGFFWFCTREGLSRFDGYKFTNYTTAHGLPHRNVTDLFNPKRDHLHDMVERMRRFASDTFTACDIEFQFSVPGANQDLKLGADLRRQVYMIFKESVNNIAKHSGCSQADIDVGISGGHLILRLSDNGTGFDIAGVDNGYGGNGLMSMRRRADALGGDLEIVSRQGAGTTVALKVRL